MSEVYNPYYFVPFAAQDEANNIAATKKALKDSQKSHDAYYNLCGEIQLSLKTVSATIVGNQQIKIGNAGASLPAALANDNKDANFLFPYLRYDKKDMSEKSRGYGKPAIPGNSLRGMLSSITEVISGSPARVLEDQTYVVREKTPPSQYAMGVLLADKGSKDNKEVYLHPIGMPFINWKEANQTLYQLPVPWQEIFTTANNTPMRLSEIIGLRVTSIKGLKVQSSSIPQITTSNSTLTCQHGQYFNFYSPSQRSIEDLRVNSPIKSDNPALHTTRKGAIKKRLLLEGGNSQRTATKKYLIRKTNKSQYAFSGDENGHFNAKPILLDNEKVLQPFLQLLNSTKDTQDNENGKAARLPLGEIVLFYLDDNKQIVLKKSANWRKKLEYSTHQLIGSDLVPYSAERQVLSPAEQLFGAVSASKASTTHLSSYASRLRFYDAISSTYQTSYGIEYQKMPLQGSPTPPCPEMYFGYHSGYVNNETFRHKKPAPNGAKRYLRQPNPLQYLTKIDAFAVHDTSSNQGYSQISNRDENQEEKQDKNQLRVSPLPADTVLHATIAFSNLSKDELGLLLNAIKPLDACYVHQLGLGKNLGFGQIELAITGISLIDRQQRYSPTGLQAPRAKILNTQERTELLNQQGLINQTSIRQLYALNRDYTADGHKIQYPQTKDSVIEWFLKNRKDKEANQVLSINETSGAPNPLKEHGK